MASVYRRKKGRVLWHFCRNCSRWPIRNYEEKADLRGSGTVCRECRAKLKALNCM